MPKNKKGEYYTFREFLHQWKLGMQHVTPLQQCTATQFGQLVSLVGVVWGIVFSMRIGYWWMMVILVGGLIVLSVQILGNWQKKMILKNMESLMKNAEVMPMIIKEEN